MSLPGYDDHLDNYGNPGIQDAGACPDYLTCAYPDTHILVCSNCGACRLCNLPDEHDYGYVDRRDTEL